ncbi:MAG: hypothetical protein ABJB32_06175 [Verrucomicrobiota bacterium]
MRISFHTLGGDKPKQPDQHQKGQDSSAEEAGVNDAVLTPRPAGGFGVGDARERDHGIERQIDAGQQAFEQVIELLLRPKFSV